MDALTGLLDGPRAKGAFLLRAMLDPPWSVRVQDEAPLSVMVFVRGDACVIPAHGAPISIRAGDVVIARGPDPYTVSDAPGTEPQVIVHPGERCMTPDGVDLAQAMDLGVRTWGTSPDGGTIMLIGTYLLEGELSQRLLNALPPMVTMPSGAWDNALISLLELEIGKEEPGQAVILDRLLDLLVISVLRAWFSRPEAEAPAWYRAQSDPIVGRALRMLHNNPAHPWTVASLAAELGISRAAFARRFTELVGEPPMTFLTGWRLTLAADLLREPEATIGSVARKVGYGSSFALSTAFKRVRGVSPQQFRVVAVT
jgi:AraC-like DNA-binding protein